MNMRRFVLAGIAALTLCSTAPAQRFSSAPSQQVYAAAPTLDKFYVVREKLINRYVTAKGTTPATQLVWGVSICGEEDIFNGDEYSFLCVYAYKDTIKNFFTALAEFNGDGATVEVKNKVIFVDGIPVMITLIERPKPITEEQCVKMGGEVWYDMNHNVVCRAKGNDSGAKTEGQHSRPVAAIRPARS